MRSLKRIGTIFIALAIFSSAHTSLAQDQEKEKPWLGTLKDGTRINAEDLKRILTDHEKWLNTRRMEGRRANFNNANLKKVSLVGANLQSVDLSGANLQSANLMFANLRGAELTFADLQGADLRDTNLQWADLFSAKLQKSNLLKARLQKAALGKAKLQNAFLRFAELQGVDLAESDLQGVDLQKANLTKANLWKTNLRGANFEGADLKGAIFELQTNGLPDIPSIAKAENLSLLKYAQLPHSLVELRTAFKKAGLRRQERELTYAIKHTGFLKAKLGDDWWTIAQVYLGWFLFDLTCQWGMSPLLPLVLLGVFTGVFSLFYMVPLVRKNKKDGIWKHWIEDRSRKDLPLQKKDYRPTWRKGPIETNPPELLHCKTILSVMGYGIYFSILSAFHVGWRDLNVGTWIARMQFREYTLRASGWIRMVSGFQSLISVYLFALTIMAYFGRPFESY